MPTIDTVKSSWADEIEHEVIGKKPLPKGSEVTEKNYKIITEYRHNQDNKIEKVVRTYKIEHRAVSKAIAARKAWKKYGECKDDKPGPDPASTLVSEEIQMQFITNKEEADKPEESPLDKLKLEKGLVKCRVCGGDHWSVGCPFKDTTMKLKPDEKLHPPTALSSSTAAATDDRKTQAGKYVPPSLRDRATGKRGETAASRADAIAIRVSNLPPNTTEKDLEKLIKPFGAISKLFLAKERSTGVCKGFAYIHYKNRADAVTAMAYLNGFGYDHLILNVDWSKPNN